MNGWGGDLTLSADGLVAVCPQAESSRNSWFTPSPTAPATAYEDHKIHWPATNSDFMQRSQRDEGWFSQFFHTIKYRMQRIGNTMAMNQIAAFLSHDGHDFSETHTDRHNWNSRFRLRNSFSASLKQVWPDKNGPPVEYDLGCTRMDCPLTLPSQNVFWKRRSPTLALAADLTPSQIKILSRESSQTSALVLGKTCCCTIFF
ncbi:hypothetical protein B0H14DRAFT_2634807 [Mycena olivaceomarginata]|nr:hypothetical protein B0H14DRAFT_2634807 [Mycena olivaceomarginata]